MHNVIGRSEKDEGGKPGLILPILMILSLEISIKTLILTQFFFFLNKNEV